MFISEFFWKNLTEYERQQLGTVNTKEKCRHINIFIKFSLVFNFAPVDPIGKKLMVQIILIYC